MTIPMPDPSISWDRTLPKPTALLQNGQTDQFTSQRTSSLLQHHIVPSRSSVTFDEARRSTVPCIAYQQRSSSPRLLEAAHIDPRFSIDGNGIEFTLTRKRAISHMAEEGDSREQSPSTSSPSATGSAGQFCLCQPEAKIPRPRNAFILYRQHQQAAVVAQNPGLANPDISKIIGEQWRSLPPKTKAEWKALAEEEKARHQQQYPDYRYQPRRNGRYSNQSSISGPSNSVAVGPQGNCLKCGGKMMNPPNTPYTPFTPATPGLPPMIALPQPPRRGYTITTKIPRPQMAQPILSPRTARVRPSAEFFGRAPVDPRGRYATTQPPKPMILDSPDPKRRRFNDNVVHVPTNNGTYQDPAYQYSPRNITFQRTEIHEPRTTMPPPPRTAIYAPASSPIQLQQIYPRHPAQARRDPNLTLPPLKTSVSDPLSTNSAPSVQKSSLEAMIHSIPVLNKVKILSQISPPLATPRPSLSTPAPEIRGAIIAIDGLDTKAVQSMTNSLAEQLEREAKFAVRIFDGPNPCTTDEGEMTTEDFLHVISEWHKVSKEMVQYITSKPQVNKISDIKASQRMPFTPPMAMHLPSQNSAGQFHRPSFPFSDCTMSDETLTGEPPTTSSHSSYYTQVQDEESMHSPASAVSPRTITQTADLSLASPMPSLTPNYNNTTTAQHDTTPTPSRHPSISTHTPIAIPIALMPTYQLSTVDRTALSLPITDSYSPLSHWQWLATLWRGCVGPDATIVVVQSSHAEHDEPPTATCTNSDTKSREAGVEVRLLDHRAVIVRVGVEKENENDKDESWEKAKRRVGFEVEEYVRM